MIAYPQTKLGKAGAVAWCALLWAELAWAGQYVPGCADGLATLNETLIDHTTRVPLTNGRVAVSWSDDRDRVVTTRTDSTGRASICVPVQRPLTIKTSYGDVQSTWQTTLSRATNAHTTYLDIPGSFVRGRVLDQQTGLPVAQAAVRVTNSPLAVLSNADGRFVFDRIPVGAYALRIEHISYATNDASLNVGLDDLDALVHLAPAAIALQPIVVTAFSRRLEYVGFYERQKRGVGTFIDRKQIDAMKVKNASELLRRAPGVRLVPQSRTRSNQPDNATIGNRGNCRYVFVIDGTRTLPDFEMDHIAAGAIEGVEVYNGLAEVPAALRAVAGHTVCGVIAIWTRNSR